MSELEQRAVALFDKLEKLTPHATEMALTAVRIDAVGTIIAGVVALCISIALLVLGRRIWAKREGHYDDLEIPAALSWMGSLIAGVIAMIILFSPWTYTALIRPDLYIAKKVLGL